MASSAGTIFSSTRPRQMVMWSTAERDRGQNTAQELHGQKQGHTPSSCTAKPAMAIMARRPLLISLVWSSALAAASVGSRPRGSKPSSPGLYSARICSVAGALREDQPWAMRCDSRMPMNRTMNSQNWQGQSRGRQGNSQAGGNVRRGDAPWPLLAHCRSAHAATSLPLPRRATQGRPHVVHHPGWLHVRRPRGC